MKRIPEVLDCWFESGAMPYAHLHYPFENKDFFEKNFPAEFIAEGQDQTRGWFYTLHVLAAALSFGDKPSVPVKESVPAFRNVVVHGIVLAEDGKKMSKKLKNYPDPNLMLEKYGADAIRYYFASSPVMHGENFNFSEKDLREVYNKTVNTLQNVLEFFMEFRDTDANFVQIPKPKNVLDVWILSRLSGLIEEVGVKLDEYRIAEASRPIGEFLSDLSTWYLRRSRDRFKNEAHRKEATQVLGFTLRELSAVMAPLTPFVAEAVFLSLHPQKDSVHLESWPKIHESLRNEEVKRHMENVRKLVELGLSLRAEYKIKVRQPLSTFWIKDHKELLGYRDILADELNVKEVVFVDTFEEGSKAPFKEEKNFSVALDIEISESLRQEGVVRDMVRHINSLRKKKGLRRTDRTTVTVRTKSERIGKIVQDSLSEILKETVSDDVLMRSESGEGEDSLCVEGEFVSFELAMKQR